MLIQRRLWDVFSIFIISVFIGLACGGCGRYSDGNKPGSQGETGSFLLNITEDIPIFEEMLYGPDNMNKALD